MNAPSLPQKQLRLHALIVASLLTASLIGCVQAPTKAPIALKPRVGTDVTSLKDAGATIGKAVIEGRAIVPSGLLSNNGGGIIANNGSALISNNGGGIIANNGSAYRVASFGLLSAEEVPLANALTYMTTPADEFYKIDGETITTHTDAKGGYRFAQGVPQDKPVIVNVLLSENRRVVGFTVPVAGTNEVNVSVASTYVTEYLRHRAKLDGKTMADYDLKLLPTLAAKTAQAMATGKLPTPDLGIGAIARMNMTYSIAVGQNLGGLGDTWAEMLGYRPIVGTIAAGSGITDNGGIGKSALEAEFYRLKGVCMDAAGNTYLADEGNHRIVKIDAATGKTSVVAGNGSRGFSGDGGAATDAERNHPRAVVLDAAGNLYIFDSQNVRVRKVEKATGLITTFAGNPEPRGGGFWENGHAGDGGPATEAKLFSPRGGAFDSKGNLYVVDGLKGFPYHTIRKIAPDGTISTIAGMPGTDGGFAGEKVDATQAVLNYTNQIWVTPDDQLYMADTYNNCIRKIDLATNVITTVAGVAGQRGDKPDADGKLATETLLNGPYGVAVDKQGHLYISERGNHRLLVVRKDGRMYTIAGGGEFDGEGEGRQLSFSEPHDLWIEPDGNVLMTDTRNSKLRRFWTKFGF
ncbi:MAG: hypothetical protein ACLGIN_08225 [Candidatus Sericytochromatia bacterium]